MKKLVARLLPILGFLFLTAYIRSATLDVVYTDYMRIVNTYFPDVLSFKPFLNAAIFARTPITYLERILSVKLFGFSTTFDMFMGAVGLTIIALIIASYASKKKVSAWMTVALLFVIFSLDKWEMLTNGTGWVHFWAFALFYYHFLVYDRVRSGNAKKNDEIKLCVLPFITILLFAGPYSVIYFCAIALVYIIDAKQTEKKPLITRMVTLVIPFALSIWSYFNAGYEHAGSTSESIFQVIGSDITLFPRMILKSFGSMVIGGETAAQWGLPGWLICIFGLIVIAAYAYAIYVNFKSGLYKESAFPMLLILSGLVSHGIVLVSRWIFKNDDYMMSSRYALQYQSGILGIMLTFALADKKYFKRAVATSFIVLVIAGHLCTTGREIWIAQFRKASFANMKATALDYKNRSDEELENTLQYHHEGQVRTALEIIEKENLNIFRE